MSRLSASKNSFRQRYIFAISQPRHSGDSEWLSRKASSNILKPPVQKVNKIVFFLYACHTAKRPLDQIFQKIIADIMYQLCVASLMSVPNHNDTFIESWSKLFPYGRILERSRFIRRSRQLIWLVQLIRQAMNKQLLPFESQKLAIMKVKLLRS